MIFVVLHCYSTDQKKPNRECLTERVLLPFHTRFRSRSVSVLYPFDIHFLSVLFCSHSASVLSLSVLATRSEERGFRELVYKNASMELATLGKTFAVCVRARIQTINLHSQGENTSRVTLKNMGRGL